MDRGQGPLEEFETPVGFLRRRLCSGPAPPSLERLRGMLDRICRRRRPRGVVLRIKNLDAGWASLEELRGEILAFRARGKPGRSVPRRSRDTRSYYLACAAGRDPRHPARQPERYRHPRQGGFPQRRPRITSASRLRSSPSRPTSPRARGSCAMTSPMSPVSRSSVSSTAATRRW